MYTHTHTHTHTHIYIQTHTHTHIYNCIIDYSLGYCEFDYKYLNSITVLLGAYFCINTSGIDK